MQNLITKNTINGWSIVNISDTFIVCIKKIRIEGNPAKTKIDLPITLKEYSVSFTEYSNTTNKDDITIYNIVGQYSNSHFEVVSSNGWAETPTITVMGLL